MYKITTVGRSVWRMRRGEFVFLILYRGGCVSEEGISKSG